MKLRYFLFMCIHVTAFSQVREIEDNSFLIEEAYNQESRVVQHILNADYETSSGKNLYLLFTQEWPVFSEKHQLSYGLPYEILNRGEVSQFGDFIITYRYQLSEKTDWAASAPSFSVIIPARYSDLNTGYRIALPVSKRLSKYFAGHFNAGTFLFPSAEIMTDEGISEELKDDYFIGASLIWLSGYSVNFLLEYLHEFSSQFDVSGRKYFERESVVSPGIRFAIDFNDLQVVPGIAVPVNLSDETAGIFLYLSFEHSF